MTTHNSESTGLLTSDSPTYHTRTHAEHQDQNENKGDTYSSRLVLDRHHHPKLQLFFGMMMFVGCVFFYDVDFHSIIESPVSEDAGMNVPVLKAGDTISESQRECTIVVEMDLRKDDAIDTNFDCILDGAIIPIDLTDEEQEKLSEQFLKGELVSNESTLSVTVDESAGTEKDDATAHFPSNQPLNVMNGPHRQRRLAPTTGKKSMLVVKVIDSENKARPESLSQISDDIFGSFGDSMTLKSQMYDCSFGKFEIVPGVDPRTQNIKEESPGVIEVKINVPLQGSSRSTIRNGVKQAVKLHYNIDLPGQQYDYVMYVLEGCYHSDCGWAAYAFMNHWLSVYQGDYYKYVGVQMHEFGHNLNLQHSGGLDGQTYTDHTGMMGNPLYLDDIGAMCFNPAKSWQLGFYDSNKVTINPKLQSSWSAQLVGIANYKSNPENHPILVKIESDTGTDQFIGFNDATGVIRQNDEADNEVMLVETTGKGERASQSFLKVHLQEGKSYVYTNWADTGKDLIVKANKIFTDDSNAGDSASQPGYGYANVQVCLGECEASAPTSPPTDSPTTQAPTPSPTIRLTLEPTLLTCFNEDKKFIVTKPDGTRVKKTCKWARAKKTRNRCKRFQGVEFNCPRICNNCCQDVEGKFQISIDKMRSCSWAAKDPTVRCRKAKTSLKCPVTCGNPLCQQKN